MHYCGEARFNGTRAAQLAGITGTYAAQASQSSNWLNELRVRAAIDAWVTAFAWSAAELTARLKDLAEANLGAFLEVDAAGTVRLRTLTAAEWASHKHWLKHVDVDPETGAVTRMEIHDSLAALRELAKVMKLYTDAPQLNLFLHLQRLSDAELVRALLVAARVSGHHVVLEWAEVDPWGTHVTRARWLIFVRLGCEVWVNSDGTVSRDVVVSHPADPQTFRRVEQVALNAATWPRAVAWVAPR
jgi:hypothetical protein